MIPLPSASSRRMTPGHDTIATFRRRFLKEIEALFVEVLKLARAMGVLRMGTVALDGTKIHANASRHSALSYEHAGEIEKQLKPKWPSSWQSRGRGSDGCARRHVDSEELGGREERLEKLAAARATIEARAKERFEREWRSTRRNSRREKRRPRPRAASLAAATAAAMEGPLPTDQVNLTDEDSLYYASGGWWVEQCYKPRR